MKKILKLFLLFSLGFVVLIVASIVALKLFIDPNDYKDRITKVIAQHTGHQVDIPGDISLHIAPNLDTSLELGAITIDSPPGFTAKPLLSSRQVAMSVAIMPLLTEKQLVINKLSMQGINLVLAVNKQGKNNWTTEQLSASKTTSEKPAHEKPTKKKGISGMDIGSIELKDINLLYNNEIDGTTAALSQFNLTTGRIIQGAPFSLNTDFHLALSQPEKADFSVTASMATTLLASLSENRFTADKTTITLHAAKNTLLPGALRLKAELDADAQLQSQKVQINLSGLEINDIKLKGALALDSFTNPQLSGTLNIFPFSPRQALADFNIDLPRTADPSVLEKFGLSLDFRASPTSFSTKTLQAVLDDSTLSSSLSVKDFTRKPHLQASLTLDNIDLDRYKTATRQSAAETPEHPGPDNQPKKLIPVDLLRSLEGDVQLAIGKLKAGRVSMSDISAKASAHNGTVVLTPFSAKLYNGTVEAEATIDVNGKLPEIDFAKSINQVEIGQLLTDIKGKAELTGTANIEVKAKTRGADRRSLTGNADGMMSVSLKNGVITKLKILDTIRQAKALIEKETVVASAAEQPTGFALLTATGTLNNGVFVNNDLLAESDLMKVTGKGTIDLNTELIDYLLTVYLTDRVGRQEETGLVALGNKPIPYRIRGSLSDLEQSAALGEIIKTELQGVLLNELQKQLGTDIKNTQEAAPEKSEPKEKISPESLLQQGLKGLFGN